VVADPIVRTLGGRRVGRKRTARSPAHDDHEQSLSIRIGKNGKVLVHCHAGCEQHRIRDPLEGIVEKITTDPGAPFASDTIERLRALKEDDRAVLEALRAQLKKVRHVGTAARPSRRSDGQRQGSRWSDRVHGRRHARGLASERASAFARAGPRLTSEIVTGHRRRWSNRERWRLSVGKHGSEHARIERDHYPTPQWVLADALAEHLDSHELTVWESACGFVHIECARIASGRSKTVQYAGRRRIRLHIQDRRIPEVTFDTKGE